MISLKEITNTHVWSEDIEYAFGSSCDSFEYHPDDEDMFNSKAEPMRIIWQETYGNVLEPLCPACNEMCYENDHCVFCGQRFLPDDSDD